MHGFTFITREGRERAGHLAQVATALVGSNGLSPSAWAGHTAETTLQRFRRMSGSCIADMTVGGRTREAPDRSPTGAPLASRKPVA